MMLRMKREFAGSQNQILPVFDTLLLLDRNVDLLTPLATQLTYEGLIDEIYGINNGQKNKSFILFQRAKCSVIFTVSYVCISLPVFMLAPFFLLYLS